ncbi:hypothetical protein [Prosthecobacter sp.]|uniref:hypothetical protein n=1 Tax=Prosthecobacter sp. TaxID=1965333 RepID=UPI003783D4C7
MNEADFHLAAVSPLVHFETCTKVQNATTKRLERPRANVLQRRMAEAVEVLTAVGVEAVRIIVTKVRQCGGTTFSVEVIYHLCQQRNTDALILANITANSQGILDRLRTFSAHDRFPWRNALEPRETRMRWANGSTATITSAESMNPGISKPRQAVLFSESAKYPRGGVKDDRKIMASILPSLNDAGIAIAESTPDGASGWHYETWQGALGLEDYLAGLRAGEAAPGNGWVKVFAAWFEFEENVKPVTEAMRAKIDTTLTAREANGRRRYDWTHEQIAWRRAIMAQECSGSEDVFDEFYPEDDVSCFLSSGRPRFNVAVVRRLERAAQLHAPEVGSLVEVGDAVEFQRDATGFGSFQIWERPQVGCSYIVWCDPMTGEDQAESGDPDRHSIGVLRTEYHQAGGACYKDAVVARVRPPFTGTTQLTADSIALLSEYYGGALVVLEVNMGLHVLERLKDAGVPLYKRQVVDPYDRERQNFMLGWKLKDRDQRRDVIDSLALAFHNETLEVWCPHILGECKTFVIDKNGKETARAGCHDDDVMGLAMAHRCKGSATLYKPTVRRRRRPGDYQRVRG